MYPSVLCRKGGGYPSGSRGFPGTGRSAKTDQPQLGVCQQGIRYVCPQRIDISSGEDVTLFFRTTAPGRETTMSALDGEDILTKKKLGATTPGAMEKLVIPAEKLASLANAVRVTATHKEVLA